MLAQATNLFDPPGRTNERIAEKASPEHRPPAWKIHSSIGPFETAATSFDKGVRAIEIVRITPHGITYRLKGRSDEYTITHEQAFMRAISNAVGFDTAARESTRITRGGVS